MGFPPEATHRIPGFSEKKKNIGLVIVHDDEKSKPKNMERIV